MTSTDIAPAHELVAQGAALALAGQLAESWRDSAAERDRERAFPHEEIARLKASGLQALGVPCEHGGPGTSYGDRARTLGRLAETDPSIAQIYLVQLFWSEVVNYAAPQALKQEFNQRIVDGDLWLGNAASEIGTKTSVQSSLTISSSGSDWLINGRKFYCTGSLAADELVVTGVDPATEQHRLAFVGVDAEGLTIIDDWSGLGQRGTASGSIEFVNVRVPAARVPDPAGFMDVFESRTSMITVLAQNFFAAIYTGIAKNALHDAIDYVTARARPWFQSGVDRASDDPHVLRHVGRMKAQLDATEALKEQAFDVMDDACAAPSEEARGLAIVEASKAKLMATEVGLEICERLFQICGASSTVAKYDMDRHWRNMRTLTLHDPVDYKAQLIGDHVLNGRFPEVSYYT
ncbi:acyl-CoA dehydrogenase family protein [Pseudonocardia sp. H11422]|uniref:acyl-CoA dehydrogenase family protein n=1 Tax=Pseudonocardia sp. H11422 TaxID=2835866 RepID=UPI001BDD9729|nr:acyl-CoA dehydrogenase family protein [Pseudonocardia sp. H11422]